MYFQLKLYNEYEKREDRLMFKNERKEKFSLRKYKDGRTDSKLIGATLLVGMGIISRNGIIS